MKASMIEKGDVVTCTTESLWDRPKCMKSGRYAPHRGLSYYVTAARFEGDTYVLELAGLDGWWSATAFEAIAPVRPDPRPPLPTPPGYGEDITRKDYREFGSRKGEALKDRDNVNLPEHYARFKHEPVRFSMENRLDAFQFNIIKYTCRHDSKNGIEDIDKVIRYATMYKRFLLGDPAWWEAPK